MFAAAPTNQANLGSLAMLQAFIVKFNQPMAFMTRSVILDPKPTAGILNLIFQHMDDVWIPSKESRNLSN